VGAESDAPVPATVPDPRKKLLRARRQGPRRLVFRGGLAAGLVWWTATVGNVPGIEFREVLLSVVTGIAGLSVLEAVATWGQAMSTPLPPAAPDPPAELPPVESAARVPLERLAGRERSLRELLALLGGSAGDAARDVAVAAGKAAATLREYGAKLRAVESARDGMDGEVAANLEAAVATLRQRLEEGVSSYDRLVAVAAEAVSADTAGGLDTLILRRLEDAADTLAGLARGLREVSPGS
jgi:hypothetical protein